jgi:hypothetical protein
MIYFFRPEGWEAGKLEGLKAESWEEKRLRGWEVGMPGGWGASEFGLLFCLHRLPACEHQSFLT